MQLGNEADKRSQKAQGSEEPSRAPHSQLRVVNVEIAGLPLRLRTSHSESRVKELVALVDQKVREALPMTKTDSLQNAGLLACLSLADTLMSLRDLVDGELLDIEKRTTALIEQLDSQPHHDLTSPENRPAEV